MVLTTSNNLYSNRHKNKKYRKKKKQNTTKKTQNMARDLRQRPFWRTHRRAAGHRCGAASGHREVVGFDESYPGAETWRSWLALVAGASSSYLLFEKQPPFGKDQASWLILTWLKLFERFETTIYIALLKSSLGFIVVSKMDNFGYHLATLQSLEYFVVQK